jgi:hypothetical protein
MSAAIASHAAEASTAVTFHYRVLSLPRWQCQPTDGVIAENKSVDELLGEMQRESAFGRFGIQVA